MAVRLKNPEWRRYAALVFGGKALGLAVLMLIITVISGLFFSHVYAADVEVKAADVVNPLNTVWTLIAAFLVFGMQVGFTMLEAGFCRSRETVNVLMECVVDTCLCGILFYAFGFCVYVQPWQWLHRLSLVLSPRSAGNLRDNWGRIPGLLAVSVRVRRHLFHHHVRGDDRQDRFRWRSSLQRRRFRLHLSDHWSLGVGARWMAGHDGQQRPFIPSLGMGFHDFAGSTVVHTIGGFIALAGAIVLGPRLGRTFKRDGGAPMLPHDLTIAISGGLILWFGWYGFNPGSTLSAMDFEGIGRVAANTTLAACAAGLTAMFWAYTSSKKWDVGFTTNGFLAGLVAITCPCYWVSPDGRHTSGRQSPASSSCSASNCWSGCALMIPSERFRFMAYAASGEHFRWACLRVANMEPRDPWRRTILPRLTGLFYGGGTQVLIAQAIGSLVDHTGTFSVAMALMYLVNATGLLRVSEEGELYGLDLHEHGISAYPEYLISALGAPSGLSQHVPKAIPSRSSPPVPCHGLRMGEELERGQTRALPPCFSKATHRGEI